MTPPKIGADPESPAGPLHYLSFATTEDGFRGAVFMYGHTVTFMAARCHQLGINPGGQVLCIGLTTEECAAVPRDWVEKLLTKADILSIWPDAKSVGDIQQDSSQ